MTTMLRTGAVLLALLLLALPALAQDRGADVRLLRVQGQAEASAPPDQARFTGGVRVRDASSQEAMRRAGAIGDRIVAALKKLGIPEADMETVQIGLHRQDSYGPEGRPRPEATAWEATHILQVEVGRERFPAIGEILAAATAAGANEVGDIQFGLANPAALQGEGLARAIADARAKADRMAAAAGVAITGVYTVSEAGVAGPPIPYARTAMAEAAQAPQPIPPSEIRRTYQVEVEYLIR